MQKKSVSYPRFTVACDSQYESTKRDAPCGALQRVLSYESLKVAVFGESPSTNSGGKPSAMFK